MELIFNKKASALLSVLLALAIIGLIYWVTKKMNQKNAPDATMMKDAGIDTSSYKSTIDSARKIAAEASKPRE